MTTWKKFSQIFDPKTRKEINIKRIEAGAWMAAAFVVVYKAICKNYNLGAEVLGATNNVLINKAGCMDQLNEAAKELIKEHNL